MLKLAPVGLFLVGNQCMTIDVVSISILTRVRPWVSCNTRFYQQYLGRVLDKGRGISKGQPQEKFGIIFECYIVMRSGQDMDKAIGNNISMVYSLSYLIRIADVEKRAQMQGDMLTKSSSPIKDPDFPDNIPL